ncbi:MAG: glycoside hydrolase family 3 protein [Frankia sp.]|nr:glycoside hydrolase family 3 protein [Frankia sp.]
MTLAEKVGQMAQTERAAAEADPELLTSLGFGSVLSGGGSSPADNSPTGWADMIDGLQERALATRLGIPLLYGVDAVHGHNSLVGATIFPHNIGLGATRDPDLAQEAARITAMETRATGPQWTFSPCLCVTRDLRWGRTYESFGEDPELVAQFASVIAGYQGAGEARLAGPDHVLATAKHFAGDGDTVYGTSTTRDYRIDQGVTISDRAHFEAVNLVPYVTAVQTYDVGSIMPSFSSIDWTEDGVGNPTKLSASTELLTGFLKERTGFDGFLISDWEAIHQLPGDYATQVRTAVNAGIDMFMEPQTAPEFVATLIAEVEAGRVPMARIDDAVRRILAVKFELGLFEHPFTDRSAIDQIGSAEHRAVAREAAAASQVLLKNEGGVLPLDPASRVYVAGRNADDLGNQLGGWSITWQGESGSITDGTTILAGIRQHVEAAGGEVRYSQQASAPMEGFDVGVVVIGETPYAEGVGDVGARHSLVPRLEDRGVIDRVCGTIPTCVVIIVAGRPLVITDQLATIDALVMAWLPGSEGTGVADPLFGERPYGGRLPVSWPRAESQEPINIGDPDYDPLFPYGHGLTTSVR